MKKILIVEDDKDISSNMAYMLSKSGYAVFVADDGASGVKMSHEKLPDLIIMDIMLPDIQGGDAVNMISKNPLCKSTPVIFLTGLMAGLEKNDGIETINVNGRAYLAFGKPFDFPQLLKSIEKHVNDVKKLSS